MNSEVGKRIGIVASVVGAVGALVYLLRGDQATILQAVTGQGGAPGIGIAGTPGAAGAMGSIGAVGAAGVDGVPGRDGTSPSLDALNAYYASAFTPVTGPYPNDLSYNLPPALDLDKSLQLIQPSSGGDGCGCGGSCGSGGGCSSKSGKCPNAAAPIAFPDGSGACASTTVGRLQQSMDSCVPDNLQLALANMIGSTQYYGVDSTPDFSAFQLSVADSLSQLAPIYPGTNLVPQSRFGAS